jgi:hypothetical protein
MQPKYRFCIATILLFYILPLQIDDDDDDEEEEEDDEQDSAPSAAGAIENGFGASRCRKSGSNPWHRTGITHHEYHSYIDSTLECRRQSVN